MKAIRKGLLKVMSKMGIATISSYCGAQVFEAVGLDRDLVDRYFGGTPSAVGGVGLTELGIEALEMPSGAGHDAADFALAGVPAAMIFVRNDHGSHNPAEAMRMEDFALGTELLLWFLMRD